MICQFFLITLFKWTFRFPVNLSVKSNLLIVRWLAGAAALVHRKQRRSLLPRKCTTFVSEGSFEGGSSVTKGSPSTSSLCYCNTAGQPWKYWSSIGYNFSGLVSVVRVGHRWMLDIYSKLIMINFTHWLTDLVDSQSVQDFSGIKVGFCSFRMRRTSWSGSEKTREVLLYRKKAVNLQWRRS